MKVAFTMAPGRGDVDFVMAALAGRLQDLGLAVCGTVQVNSERPDDGPCDMDVKVLPAGPVIRISQSLGKEARGCRLDPDALESAVALVGMRLAAGADVLIVNKFGKHEAEGRGFRELIAEALSRDIPVVVGLNRLNAPAFRDFTDGMAVELPPHAEEISAWIEGVATVRTDAARSA
jgi:nucleoside-triphosphatase THEP1